MSPGAGVGGALLAAAAVLAYCALGGVMFFLLEGGVPAPARVPDAAAPLRARAVQRLWAITEDLNILYKDNWTALASRELEEFQRRLTRPEAPRWTLAGSCLYALTLITTIGHGNVAPKSSAGKLAAIAYACVGIPLVLLYLSAAGNLLARGVRALCRRLTGPRGCSVRTPPPAAGRTPFEAALAGVAVGGGRGGRSTGRGGRAGPAACGAVLAAGYVLGGAMLFRHTERWSLLDGCVFAFSSLATVGMHPPPRAALPAAAYIVLGVAVVAAGAELLRAPPAPSPTCACAPRAPPAQRSPAPPSPEPRRFRSLPRRKPPAFPRGAPLRRSDGAVPFAEYFVPRSVSAGELRAGRVVTFAVPDPDVFM